MPGKRPYLRCAHLSACIARTRREKTPCCFLRSVPSFRSTNFDALGEEFEKNEHKLFGGDRFEMYVGRVATIEKVLGIYDLNQFTPH
jgi:hypothetical protein